MKDLKWYMDNGQLIKTPFMSRFVDNFLEKAHLNLTTMSILSDLEKNSEARKILNVPEEYSPSEWVTITGYYSMYMAALSALAKVNYRSKNHVATVLALEEFFVKKGLLEKEILELIKRARLEMEYVEMIRSAKDKREIAQYSPTKRITELIAAEIKRDAYRFVERIEKLIS